MHQLARRSCQSEPRLEEEKFVLLRDNEKRED